jgi:hypothetical protein
VYLNGSDSKQLLRSPDFRESSSICGQQFVGQIPAHVLNEISWSLKAHMPFAAEHAYRLAYASTAIKVQE